MAFEPGQRGQFASQINVTPLVDVMLVLLVIFMVTAPMIQQGVEVNVPRVKSSALPGKEEQFVVSITRNQEVYLNDTRLGLEQLTGIRAVEEFDSDDVTLGDFRIRVAALNHPGGCAGFRIDAAGGSLAYLPDHEPGEENLKLMEFAQGVDLLILDTQYTESEYVAHRGWGHGCLSASVQFAIGAKARELVFFHHDPSHTDFHIDQMIERGRQLAGTSGLMVSAASENRNAILFEAATPKLPSLPPFILTPANAVLPTEKVVFPVEALQPGEAAK